MLTQDITQFRLKRIGTKVSAIIWIVPLQPKGLLSKSISQHHIIQRAYLATTIEAKLLSTPNYPLWLVNIDPILS